MKKYTDLIELLEKIFGKGSVSRTIGTRTNVVRFPKGKQPIDPTVSNFDVEGTAAKNPDLVQTIENSIADRMGDITKMNDQELLTYTANVRRLLNFKEPPIQNADVVKFGSGEEIKGKGLEELIEKQGTKNPPTTVAGQLETQGKKLEKAGEDLKEITEPRSLVGDMLKDYADFDKYMQSSQKTGYVRATVRQIMREDIQTGKLKLPKELQDQVMQGIGEPIDIYRKIYGEGALEQIDSLADDLGQFRTEEEAAKFARSKFEFTPKLDRPKESYTTEEMKKITSLEDPSKPYKPFGSDFTRQEKVDWLIKNVDQEAEVTIPSPEFLQNMLDSGREDLIDHFWEIHTRNIGSKPVIDIDTSNLKNPALVKAMMEDRAKKPKLVFSKEKVVEDSVDDAGKINKDDPEPEGKADGGRIGYETGGDVSEEQKLIEEILSGKIKIGAGFGNKNKDDPFNKYNFGEKDIKDPRLGIEYNMDPGNERSSIIGISVGPKGGGISFMKPFSEKLNEEKNEDVIQTYINFAKNVWGVEVTEQEARKALGIYDMPDTSIRNELPPEEIEEKANGGRIGFNKGKRVKSSIDKLLENLNKKTQGKKSMESVNPKTGEVTIPKKPIRRAEEPTGMTTMDVEPEIVDERSIPKPKKKITQRYNQDIIKAADEIYPSYDDPKIAADQIVDSYAQMKFGLEDQYGLSNKERMDLYRQAYDYVMDYNRGAIGKTAGESINISDPKTAEAFTNFAKENDPEGFKKIQKIVDDINNKNALEEFDIKNREPNANGGIAGLL